MFDQSVNMVPETLEVRSFPSFVFHLRLKARAYLPRIVTYSGCLNGTQKLFPYTSVVSNVVKKSNILGAFGDNFSGIYALISGNKGKQKPLQAKNLQGF